MRGGRSNRKRQRESNDERCKLVFQGEQCIPMHGRNSSRANLISIQSPPSSTCQLQNSPTHRQNQSKCSHTKTTTHPSCHPPSSRLSSSHSYQSHSVSSTPPLVVHSAPSSHPHSRTRPKSLACPEQVPQVELQMSPRSPSSQAPRFV